MTFQSRIIRHIVGGYLINLIKKSIYTSLITMFPNAVYYNHAPTSATGKRIIYDVFNITDDSAMATTGNPNESLRCSFQVLVEYPTDQLKTYTSVDVDSDIDTIKTLMRFNDLSCTGSGITVKTNSLLVDLITPARFDNNNKVWFAVIRFTASFSKE